MDYDKTELATGYDRGRVRTPGVLALWMETISLYAEGQCVVRILDLGCGTGRFSQALARHFNAQVIGLDPSQKMLEQAARKPHKCRIQYGRGRAEAVPLMDNAVDLIFISMVFHHFENPVVAAEECRRVLHSEGMVFVRAGTIEQVPSYPYVEFFPASRPILEQRLNTTAFIRDTFAMAGFRTITSGLRTQQVAPSYAAYADQLAAGADSVLASLRPDEFDAGLKALRAHAAQVDTRVVSEPIDFFVFR